jgi:chemotaxis protein MotB
MFASGSASVVPAMREMLRAIGSVLAEVPNRLTLEGHTDSMPYPGNERGYSNWELSADRANASRRELLAGGLPDDQVLRVQGLAAANPFDRTNPSAPANRRISIVVMTREAEERVFSATPEPLPDETGTPDTPGQADTSAPPGKAAAPATGPLAPMPSIVPPLPSLKAQAEPVPQSMLGAPAKATDRSSPAPAHR